MTTPPLPARVSLGFRRDDRLSFTGIGETRTVAQGESTIAIRDLLEELYAEATPCGDSCRIAKPSLGNHFRIRWVTQGGPMLRFYLSTVNRVRPKFEVPGDERTARLRSMVEQAFALARTDKQRIEDAAAAEKDVEDDYVAKLLAGEIVESAS